MRAVRAARGKWLRAEPVAAMYAQGKVKHVGAGFAALEDEMADFGLDGLSSGRSPDRLDALVWAVTDLAERAARRGPRIRGFADPTAGAAVVAAVVTPLKCGGGGNGRHSGALTQRANPESRCKPGKCFWIPGSPA